MAKKTHAQFEALAKAARAKHVFRYWMDRPRRLVTVAKFWIREEPKLVFSVLYCDGRAEVKVDRSSSWWGEVDFSEIEEDLQLGFKVRDFAKEVNG